MSSNNNANVREYSKDGKGSHSYSSVPASGQTSMTRYQSGTNTYEQLAMQGSSQRPTGQQTVQQWTSTWNQASGSSAS